ASESRSSTATVGWTRLRVRARCRWTHACRPRSTRPCAAVTGRSDVDEIVTMLKLYSVQVILALAGLNTVLAGIDGVPWWLMLAVNLAGVAAGYIARRAPQPAVAAKLAVLTAKRANFR